MKIIHVTDELMPSAGGLVSVPINLAAAQAANGHEVVLLGRTGKRELFESAETEKIPNFEDVVLDEAHQPGLMGKLFPTNAPVFFKKYICSDSIVHLHGVWDPFLLLASKCARKAGASYVVTPHSMLHPWQMKRYVWQKKIVFAIGWRKMFNKASFIHTLTQAEADFVKAFDFQAPLEILPNGVYPQAFVPKEPNPFLVKYPELKKAPYILFLSRLHQQKGIIHLLDGFEALADNNENVRLVLAGPDYGEKPIIVAKLARMKHGNRVYLPGSLYGAEKLGALHGAQCFALTSLNEGFSIAILEALACGLPVVISKNCFFPEVEASGAGIVCDLETKSICNALRSMFGNPVKFALMQQNALRLVESSYHWSSIAKKTEALYEKYKYY